MVRNTRRLRLTFTSPSSHHRYISPLSSPTLSPLSFPNRARAILDLLPRGLVAPRALSRPLSEATRHSYASSHRIPGIGHTLFLIGQFDADQGI